MAAPLYFYARIARLLRLAGALATLVAIGAVVLAVAGDLQSAATALQVAVPLGGAALLTAAALFVHSRRQRRQQDPS